LPWPSCKASRSFPVRGSRRCSPAGNGALASPEVPFTGAVPAGLNLAATPELGDGAKLGDGAEPVIGTINLRNGRPAGYDDVARRIRDITDMVPV
jgi:hypothetical protein